MLAAGRALQGACAAVIAPTALSLVFVLFQDPQERGRAFAVYGAIASSGGALGLVAGGALTEFVDWRWCLLLNVLVAGVAMIGGARTLPPFPAHGDVPLPVGSAALGTCTLVALVYGASRATNAGWADTGVLAALGCALLAGTLFVLAQRRAANPMLPLRLLADRARAASYLAVGTAVVGSFGLSLMLSYHFQAVLDWTPLRTGLAFLPLSLAVAVSGTLVSGALGRRVPRRWLVAGGLVVAAAGVGLIGTLAPDSRYLTLVLPSLVLVGLGMGGVFTPAIGIVTDGVRQRDAGVASAMANTAMQVGSSLGVALVNTIAVTATRSALAEGSGSADALVHGYAVAAAGTALALLAVGGLTVTALRPRRIPRRGVTRSSTEGVTMSSPLRKPPGPVVEADTTGAAGAISGLVTGVSFVTAIVGAIRLARGPFPRPDATADDVRRYYTDSADAARFSLTGQAVSVASLALFTRHAASLARSSSPGERSRSTATAASGALSALLLAASATTNGRILASPNRPDDEIRADARRAFAAGGPLHGVAYGVFTGLVASSAARAGVLGTAGLWTGRLSAASGVAAPLYFRWENAGWLIPIGRFSGYVVSGLVGVRLARAGRA